MNHDRGARKLRRAGYAAGVTDAAPLVYATARPSAPRRAWRRARWPVLALLLIAAAVLTPRAWRAADGWLVGREVARWEQRTRDLKGTTAAGRRAMARDVGDDLTDGLTHRSDAVRLAAGRWAYAVVSPDGRSRDLNPVRPPPFGDAQRDALLDAILSDTASLHGPLYVALANGCRPGDLRPAAAAWPTVPANRRTDVVRVLRAWGPQTPGAIEVLRRALRDAASPTPSAGAVAYPGDDASPAELFRWARSSTASVGTRTEPWLLLIDWDGRRFEELRLTRFPHWRMPTGMPAELEKLLADPSAE